MRGHDTMAKPSGQRPRTRRARYELPDREHPVQVEDVDGVTVVVRTHTPLTEDERHSIARYIEQLQLGGMDPIEVELPPDSLRGVPNTTPLDEATVWLDRDQVARMEAQPKASPRQDPGRCTVCGRMTCTELHHA